MELISDRLFKNNLFKIYAITNIINKISNFRNFINFLEKSLYYFFIALLQPRKDLIYNIFHTITNILSNEYIPLIQTNCGIRL